MRGAGHTRFLTNFGFFVMGQRGELIKVVVVGGGVLYAAWMCVCVCGQVGMGGSNQLNNEHNSQTGSLCFL